MSPTSAPSEGWPSARNGDGWSAPTQHRASWSAGENDGWGPATAIYGSNRRGTAATQAADSGPAATRVERAARPAQQSDWAPAGPLSGSAQRATRAAERRTAAERRAAARRLPAVQRPPERGVPWWTALLVLIVIAAIGGILDTLGSISAKGGFNIGIVIASVLAILVVRRSQMFPIVIAPPIVYSAAALFQLYVRSSGLHDRKVVLDAAANYLVYGFPAIAAATAAVLIIAGVRLITRK